MTLYVVTNGYMGNDYVRCYVIAESKKRALEIAREKYKADSFIEKYSANYYNNLIAEVMCEDTSKEYASEVTD